MLDIENHDGTDSENNSELLYQVAYCSVLKQHMDTAAVQEIVTHAQRNNLANHITGMLMIEQGLVIQWLEGDLSAVKKLWRKLQADTRHYCMVELLHRDFVKQRLFPDWSMHRATREEMLAIVHTAREQAESGEPTPWAGAIATLCILIDPEYAKSYGATLHNPAVAALPQQAVSAP